MPSCVVKWCRSHTDMKNSGITFHTFPKNELQRKIWVTAVRSERNDSDWMPSVWSRICSIHFKSDDIYITSNETRKRLRKTAVPICTMVSTVTNADPSTNLSGSSSKELCEMDEYSKNKLKEPDGKILKRLLESPCYSFLEEKKPKIEPSSEELKPLYVTPINITSPKIESVFNTPRINKLEKKLAAKSALAKKRLMKIKNLQRKVKRLNNKIFTLKDIITNLKKNKK